MTALAPKTAAAYAADWRAFSAWCERLGVSSTKADEHQIADHLKELWDPPNGRALTVATVARRYAAIKWTRAALGNSINAREPQLAAVVRDLRQLRNPSRSRNQALPDGSAAALVSTLDLRKIRHVRDKAILLLGLSTGLRPAQIVSLHLGRQEAAMEGDNPIVIVRARTLEIISPTSSRQMRRLRILRAAVETTCPVAAMERWIELAGLRSGLVFRRIGRGHTVSEKQLLPAHINSIVKRAATKAGLAPPNYETGSPTYSGLSLRPPPEPARKALKARENVVS